MSAGASLSQDTLPRMDDFSRESLNCWNGYRKTRLPASASDEEVAAIRAAFISGLRVALGQVLRRATLYQGGFDPDSLPDYVVLASRDELADLSQ